MNESKTMPVAHLAEGPLVVSYEDLRWSYRGWQWLQWRGTLPEDGSKLCVAWDEGIQDGCMEWESGSLMYHGGERTWLDSELGENGPTTAIRWCTQKHGLGEIIAASWKCVQLKLSKIVPINPRGKMTATFRSKEWPLISTEEWQCNAS